MTHLFRRGLPVLALLLALAAFRPARAAEALRSSWDALPPETVFMARVPGGNDFLALLRKQTKFGAVALSQARMDKLAAVLREGDKGDHEKLTKDLARYNLKPEDWRDLMAGEAGVALAMLPRPNQRPLLVVLSWVEPAGDLADRIVKAIQKSMDENKGKEGWPDERVDSVVAGQKVMRLTMWMVAPAAAAPANPAPADGNPAPAPAPAPGGGMGGGDNAQENPAAAADLIRTDESHVLITRIGNRIVTAMVPAQSADLVLKERANPGAKVDLDAITGVDQATNFFGRFLAAHTAPGEGLSVPEKLLSTPGLAAALPAGKTAFEFVADVGQMVKIANSGKDAHAAEIAKALGLDSLGPLAGRCTLDGNVMRGGAFLSVPTPRTGLMTLLEQTPAAPEPPAWAPTSATGYMQISFDLGKAYTRIKELIVAQRGQEAVAAFERVEGQVQGTLQTDLATLLSSLGSRHQILFLQPQAAKPAAADAGPPAAPGAGHHAPAAQPEAARVALVWQVTDVQLWQRIFQSIAPIMAQTGTAQAEEQGFTGWRLQPPMPNAPPVGLFLGDKYLTMTFGPNVPEAVLSWLRNPPEGKDAMRASPLYQRAKALVGLEPGLFFHVMDADRSARGIRDAVAKAIDEGAAAEMRRRGGEAGADDEAGDDAGGDQPAPAVGGADDAAEAGPAEGPKAMAARLKALLPSNEELEGMFGPLAQQTVLKGPGLTHQIAVELPPPGK